MHALAIGLAFKFVPLLRSPAPRVPAGNLSFSPVAAGLVPIAMFLLQIVNLYMAVNVGKARKVSRLLRSLFPRGCLLAGQHCTNIYWNTWHAPCLTASPFASVIAKPPEVRHPLSFPLRRARHQGGLRA